MEGPLRILVDTSYQLRRPFSGTAIYTQRVCEALRQEVDVEVFEAANQRRRPPAGGGLGSVRNLLSDERWLARELPRRAARVRAQVIHHPLPARVPFSPRAQVVTVHDLAFERLPDQFAPGFRRYAHRRHRAAARAADAVICVSQATARDVQELWGVPERRIVVAHHGPGQELPVAEPVAPSHQHFLYVGDDEPRKDLDGLVAAYCIYRQAVEHPLPLVLAGGAARVGAGIHCEHHPSRRRLAELHASAVALIQPSRYEGFGMAALEAMTAGTPVLASGISALREVCGEAALYVDPGDPRGLAGALERLAGDPQLRRSLAERGRRQGRRFSWAQSARAHLAAYAMALERLPSTRKS